MTETYTVRVETRFEAAHNLRSYKGAPEPLHGHSWLVEAKFLCTKLDHEDIAIDYVACQNEIQKLGTKFDHRYINEIAPFDKLNPTSENLARWFFDQLSQIEMPPGATLNEVIVWEGPNAYVSHTRK